MVCGGGGGGVEPPEGGGEGVWERASRDRPFAEPLCGVPFNPILGPRDGRASIARCPHVGPREHKGYVLSTKTDSRLSLWGKLGA